MNQAHLSDDRLIELCLVPGGEETPRPQETQHLIGCLECESRRLELVGLLDDVSATAVAEADAAFPVEKLSRQLTRILQRIEQDGRPARVITFPAGPPSSGTSVRTHRTTRWVAAAAAAAFVIGLLTGHFAHDVPRFMPRTTRLAGAPVAHVSPSPIRAASVVVPVSDDEFLGELEMAVGSAGPAALRRIDVLTPRAWEVGR